jgi:carboxyl-terminal processing protease
MRLPAFLNSRTRAAFTSAAIASVVLAFLFGTLFGEGFHKSVIDDSISQVLKHDSKKLDKSELERAAIEAILKSTGDQWANYFPSTSAQEFTRTLEGRYSGIGIWLRKNRSGAIEISSVQPHSPAASVGLKTLDVINKINGQSINGVSLATAVGTLRGEPGTAVTIDFDRNQDSHRVSVQRAAVLNGDVIATQIAPKIVYIQVSAFSSTVSAEVARALFKYPHSKGIILDLRDNPGGLIEQASSVASQFLSEGPIVSYSRRNQTDVVLTSSNSSPDVAPMTVLINRSTASAAEVLAGALQDRNRAVVIGETSYGKGTVQEISTLFDGSKIEITVGKYRTPSGQIIDQVGITPDLSVTEDQEIAKAIQVLGGLAALDTGKSGSTK